MIEKPKWSRKSLKKTLALMEAERAEDARRLARYDEAIRLLREAREGSDLISFSLTDRIEAFLAAEPKVGEGGR